MKKSINISKTYTVTQTVEEAFAKLDAVISSPFNDSNIFTWGSLDATEPPVFLLMLKWLGYFNTLRGEVFSTKLSVKLFNRGDKTQIDISTQTNPIVFVLLVLLPLSAIPAIYRDHNGLTQTLFLLAIFMAAILGFDRAIKNMLIAGFEEDFGVMESPPG